MDVFSGPFFNITEEGLIYRVMATGIYITYRALGFPDLSVDGAFPLGMCVTEALIAVDVNLRVARPTAFLAGAVVGCVTGLLRVKLHVTDLLSGILVMTGLWSVNLVTTRGSAVLPLYNKPIIFTSGPIVHLMPLDVQDYRVVLIVLLVVIVVKVPLDLYLKAKSGLLFRTSGNNPQYVTLLGKDPGRMRIAGFAVGNGYTALAGSTLTQQAKTANIYGGTGMVVMTLAPVIIGTSLSGKIKFIYPTTMVTIDTILYKTCLVIAMQLGLSTNYLKLPMALLFTLVLVGNQTFSGRRKHPHVVNPTQI